MLSIIHKNSVSTGQEVITPGVMPSIIVDPKVNDEILAKVENEGTVIVHCSFTAVISSGIRIWSSTFLVDKISGHRSKLLHAVNIPFALTILPVKPGTTARFTLFFSALPKSCNVFDLIEKVQTPDVMGFTAYNVKRNASDIYNVVFEDAPF
jgi:hypothetical protein